MVILSLLAETPSDIVYYWRFAVQKSSDTAIYEADSHIRMGAWIDFGLMTLTFFLSIFYNVEVGIIVSLIISLLLVVRRSSKTRMKILVSYCNF